MPKQLTPPRLTLQGLKMLKVFCRDGAPLAGADIMREAHISSGTMYPLLSRFEAAKIITGTWETTRPQDLQRPRRRLYHLTKEGAVYATRALDEVAR